MFTGQAALAIENCFEYEKTLSQSQHDSLTSLWNHGYFQWRLEAEMAKLSKNNAPLSLLMADLDHFKKFNDTFGHYHGDIALRRIAEVLQSSSRETGIPCRYGGEEFALIIPYRKKEDAFSTAERFLTSVEQISVSGASFTVSIGLASFPQDSDNKGGVIQAADLTLYRAKEEGRIRVVLA